MSEGLGKRIQGHWFIVVIGICATVAAATWFAANELLVKPRDFEIKSLQDKLKEQHKAALIHGSDNPAASLDHALKIIDKLSGQITAVVTGAPSPVFPQQHRLIIERDGTNLVSRQTRIVNTITGAQLDQLPPDIREHINTIEAAMENHYARWAELYPKRGLSTDPAEDARIEADLKSIILRMRDDLNAILTFLEGYGIQLDDHYMNIRSLVNSIP